jgi:DNA adenine methylase
MARVSPNTLFYLDSPYVPETRADPTTNGTYEMTREEHFDLLDLIGCDARSGRVMISGYSNQLYDDMLCTWNRHDFELPNNAASGDSKQRMVESVWCNF